MDRRNFLKILGLTSGAAVVTSCGVDKANEKVIPWVIPPEEEVYPGKPLFRKTTCTECPANCGMSVRINEKVYQENRGLFPTKLEGIEGHPVNDGALCMRGQAGLYHLYHPDRIKRPMMRDNKGKLRITTWEEAYDRIRKGLAESGAGRSHYYLAGRTTGTLSELIDQFCSRMNVEKGPEFEPLSQANVREANRRVFGKAAVPHYDLKQSDYLITIGADLFETFVSPVNYANQFGEAVKKDSFRWTHLEPHVSLTGLQAKERKSIKPKSEFYLLAYLLKDLYGKSANRKLLADEVLQVVPQISLKDAAQRTGLAEEKIEEIARNLREAEKPLLIAGGVSTAQPEGLQVALLAAYLQWSLDMTSNAVSFESAVDFSRVGGSYDMRQLSDRLQQNRIGVLFISNADPLSALPLSYRMKENLANAGLRVGLADYMSETVQNCDVILPLSHALESWGDAEPRRDLISLIQPAIEPQYDTKAEGEILLELMRGNTESQQSYKDFLFSRWQGRFGESGFQDFLDKGFAEVPPAGIDLAASAGGAMEISLPRTTEAPHSNTLIIVPSIRTYDGRSRILPLLTEIPDPLSTITYGEWVSISPGTARRLDLIDRDVLKITSGDFSIALPVKIQPLLQDGVFMVQRDFLPLSRMDLTVKGPEVSAYLTNIQVEKTGARAPLAVLAGSMHEENRGLLPLSEEEVHHAKDAELYEWYPEHEHNTYRWGMAIDLDSCIGCNACSAACYVENNIPIVGAEEHLKGREMSWIRLEPFLVEEEETMEFVPMLCQHCDNAPCESVCPVYAAYHNEEGLNVQVYNRCVGTRYCSNNCPYKVRRFNWFDNQYGEPLDKMYNPDVSVRTRGIMEKCTFCVQRIRHAKDHAKDEDRIVQDGEIVPACAQTCPTNAITFGNLLDKNSRVYKLAHSDPAYRALEELGTEPAVHYLRKRKSKEEA
ncbi:MAG: molybdopterin-dependent oxidoreductase [Calditrichia bacterium]